MSLPDDFGSWGDGTVTIVSSFARSAMTALLMAWNQIYKLKGALRSSLWLVPIIAIPLELLTIRIVHWLDGSLGWHFLGLGATGAQTLLQTIVTATLSFVVFTFGSLLVAIQVA